MKQVMCTVVSLMTILMVNGMAAWTGEWTLHIENSRLNKDTVRVDAKWYGDFCRDNYAMFIGPGGHADIKAGICDLKSVHVNHPHGYPMFFGKNTGNPNPVNGLGIVLYKGQYMVVPLDTMRKYEVETIRAYNDAKAAQREAALKQARKEALEQDRRDFLKEGEEIFKGEDSYHEYLRKRAAEKDSTQQIG